MDTVKIGLLAFCSVAVVQSLFLSTALFIYDNKENKSNNFFLGLLLIGLSLRIGKSIAIHVFDDYHVIGSYIGCVGLWIIGPSLWLSVKSNTSKLDLIWYLPVLLLAILGLWLSPDFLSMAYAAGNIGLVFFCLFSFLTKRHKNQDLAIPPNFITAFIILFAAIFFFQYYSSSATNYFAGSLLACILLYSINLRWLFRKFVKKRKANIPTSRLREIKADLEQLLERSKLYLEKGVNISRVSSEVGHPAYLLSKTINQIEGKSFTEYINDLRVEDVAQKLRDPSRSDKVEVLAKETGFSSTSSLYEAFKKRKGVTLDTYRKSHSN